MNSKITFRLNNGLKTEENNTYKIYFRFRIGRNVDFKASIGFQIKCNDWNAETGLPKKHPTKIKDYHLILSRIEGLTSYFNSFKTLNELNNKTPSYEEIKEYFNNYLEKPVKKNKQLSFFEFVDVFIEESKTKVNIHAKNDDGSPVKERTLINYKNTKNVLKDFNDEKYKITFENINMDFYNDFVLWCKNKGFKTNYIGKHIKTLKTFLGVAIEKNLTNNIQFKQKSFRTLQVEVDNIFLNEIELNKILKVDLSNSKHLEPIRDLFLLSCYTGLRSSDLLRLSHSNFIEVSDVIMVEIKQQKTNEVVNIPLKQNAINILKKYDNKEFPKVVIQVYNRQIKDLGKLAEITELVEIEEQKGTLKLLSKIEKYKLISSHTGRRSFCTNLYLTGVSAVEVMSLSGHKSEHDFFNYIKVSKRENAVNLSKKAFFNSNTNLKVV